MRWGTSPSYLEKEYSMWVALKAMTIKRGKSYIDVKRGDAVPEADTWPNRKAWINQKYIAWAPDLNPEDDPDLFADSGNVKMTETEPEPMLGRSVVTLEPEVEEKEEAEPQPKKRGRKPKKQFLFEE